MKKILGFVVFIAIILNCVSSPIYSATQKESILFESSFDNSTGLNFLMGSWLLSNGDLTCKQNTENRLVFEGTNKTDYTIILNATYLGGATGRSGYGIYFRATQDPNISGYCFQYDPGAGKVFGIRKVINGVEGSFIKKAEMNIMGDTFNITAPHIIVLTVKGNTIIASVDGKEVLQFSDNTFSSGYVGLRSWATSQNLFHNIKINDLAPTPMTDKDRVYLEFSYAYLYGYENGRVGATDTIKREEASALIYRLLKQNNKLGDFTKPSSPTFLDVAKNRWSFSAIEYMTSIGVFDTNTSILKPGAVITRGEASKIIAYSMGLQPNQSIENTFTDLSVDNMYYSSVKALVDIGLLRGYEDGTIRPNGNLTRAEYVTMINRLIDRDDRYMVDGIENIYPDISLEHWAYNDIIRASFGFSDDGTGKFNMDLKKKLKRSEIDYN